MPGKTGRADSAGRIYVTVRIDPDLIERIDQEAVLRCVSRTFLLEKAVHEWLEAHEGAA